MTPFRQTIRPGDTGGDVWAVKRAYLKMGIRGAGTLGRTKRAGPAFVTVTGRIQRQHGLKADGIYGPATHQVVAPHFDAYGAMLYRTAAIRNPPAPPIPIGNAQALAKQLLAFHDHGKYHADNPGDLRDIEATAAGRAVWSQGGYWIHIDPRPLRVLIWLIEAGHTVSTYAICSDHHNDGPHGHAGGRAVDITGFDGTQIGSHGGRAKALELARLLRAAPGDLHPRQLITGGYGYVRDSEISLCSLPGADSFYGSETMRQHCNHAHWGA